MTITKQSHPHLHRAFELISHDRGTQAGHETYDVPPRWDHLLGTFDLTLGTLSPDELEEFCIGEFDKAEAIKNAYGIFMLHKFLEKFFNEWVEDDDVERNR